MMDVDHSLPGGEGHIPTGRDPNIHYGPADKPAEAVTVTTTDRLLRVGGDLVSEREHVENIRRQYAKVARPHRIAWTVNMVIALALGAGAFLVPLPLTLEALATREFWLSAVQVLAFIAVGILFQRDAKASAIYLTTYRQRWEQVIASPESFHDFEHAVVQTHR